MEILLLACSVTCGALKSILSKCTQKEDKSLKAFLRSNIVIFFFAFVTLLLFSIGGFSFKAPIVLAILYALFTLMSQISLMIAVENGPVSISSLFYSCGFIIPTIWGCIHYKEGVNVLHIIGLALIILSFVLSVKKGNDKKFNIKWLIAALGGLLFSGLVGVIQKLFASDYTTYTLNGFLNLSFVFILAFGGLFYGIAVLYNHFKEKGNSIQNEQEKKVQAKAFPWETLAFAAGLGICMALVNKMNTYLSGVLPSIIVFPVLNGGVILLASILSLFIFKEKLGVKQKFGIGVGVLAIVIIALGQII